MDEDRVKTRSQYEQELREARAVFAAMETHDEQKRKTEREAKRKFKFLYSKIFWANLGVGSFWIGVVVGVIGLLYLCIMGLTADDADSWTEIDNNGNCYVHEVDHNNGWLTPGHNWTERQTFCMSNVVPE